MMCWRGNRFMNYMTHNNGALDTLMDLFVKYGQNSALAPKTRVSRVADYCCSLIVIFSCSELLLAN